MAKKTKRVLKHQCMDCEGTGLYQGMCEAADEAVICLECEGTGEARFEYEVFTGRRPMRGIKTVRWSAGRAIIGRMGGRGASITYRQFRDGKFPPNV
jgi:hypothetical protein